VSANGTTTSTISPHLLQLQDQIKEETTSTQVIYGDREGENKVKKEVYMAAQERVRLEKLETTTENKFLKF